MLPVNGRNGCRQRELILDARQLPYYGKYKKEGDAFAAASTDAKGHYELLVPPDLPDGFVYKLSFSAQGRYRQYIALDTSQVSAGQVVTKDVVLK